MAKEPITVVAALIEDGGGRLLVCQRRRGDAFELKWEFPGGKVQPGEPPRKALERELREELGVESEIGEEIYRTRHFYAQLDAPVELLFFPAKLKPEKVTNLAFERMAWTEPEKLPALDFLPADSELVEKLAREGVHLRKRSGGA
jgi:8-oxo-dGTP diphosphatase